MDNIIKVLYVVNFKFFEPVQKMNLQNKWLISLSANVF